MDFPFGSLAMLIALIMIAARIVPLKPYFAKLLSFGLVGVLLGGFLTIPVPAPQGIQVLLNIGHTLIPGLISLMFWLEATLEERYRISLGTLSVSLICYALTALLDLEPGLLSNPLLFTVPVIATTAMLIGKNPLSGAFAVVNGCLTVMLIRYLEVIFLLKPAGFMEIPGGLLWETMSLATVGAVAAIAVFNQVESYLARQQADAATHAGVPVLEDCLLTVENQGDESGQEQTEFVPPETS